MVDQLAGIGETVHDRAQQQKLLVARRLYQLIREGVFLRTEVRRVRKGKITDGFDSIIAIGPLEQGTQEWVYLEPDGALKAGQTYELVAGRADAPGIDLRQSRFLSDDEYITWAPAALAAIRDRRQGATPSEVGARVD
jgi:hypothetical protein